MIRNAQAEIQLPSYWSMSTDTEMEPLFLKHVMLSFILCLVGLGLGLVVFGYEMGHNRFKSSVSKKSLPAERALASASIHAKGEAEADAKRNTDTDKNNGDGSRSCCLGILIKRSTDWLPLQRN